ncbi:hypothetical protein D3C86_1836360 [compost metagenome]
MHDHFAGVFVCKCILIFRSKFRRRHKLAFSVEVGSIRDIDGTGNMASHQVYRLTFTKVTVVLTHVDHHRFGIGRGKRHIIGIDQWHLPSFDRIFFQSMQ